MCAVLARAPKRQRESEEAEPPGPPFRFEALPADVQGVVVGYMTASELARSRGTSARWNRQGGRYLERLFALRAPRVPRGTKRCKRASAGMRWLVPRRKPVEGPDEVYCGCVHGAALGAVGLSRLRVVDLRLHPTPLCLLAGLPGGCPKLSTLLLYVSGLAAGSETRFARRTHVTIPNARAVRNRPGLAGSAVWIRSVVQVLCRLHELEVLQGPVGLKDMPDHFSPGDVNLLLRSCPKLRALFLELPPRAVERLFLMRPQGLRVLVVHSWALAGGARLDGPGPKMKLRQLEFMKYCQLGSANLAAVARLCPELEYLAVAGHQLLGATALAALDAACPRLKFLIMNQNPSAFGHGVLRYLAKPGVFRRLRFVALDCPPRRDAAREVHELMTRVVASLGRRTVIKLTPNLTGLAFYPDLVKLGGVGTEGDERARLA